MNRILRTPLFLISIAVAVLISHAVEAYAEDHETLCIDGYKFVIVCKRAKDGTCWMDISIVQVYEKGIHWLAPPQPSKCTAEESGKQESK